jgi:hypothetical protein
MEAQKAEGDAIEFVRKMKKPRAKDVIFIRPQNYSSDAKAQRKDNITIFLFFLAPLRPCRAVGLAKAGWREIMFCFFL